MAANEQRPGTTCLLDRAPPAAVYATDQMGILAPLPLVEALRLFAVGTRFVEYEAAEKRSNRAKKIADHMSCSNSLTVP